MVNYNNLFQSIQAILLIQIFVVYNKKSNYFASHCFFKESSSVFLGDYDTKTKNFMELNFQKMDNLIWALIFYMAGAAIRTAYGFLAKIAATPTSELQFVVKY